MKELVRTFKALSDPTRLRIFRLLLRAKPVRLRADVCPGDAAIADQPSAPFAPRRRPRRRQAPGEMDHLYRPDGRPPQPRTFVPGLSGPAAGADDIRQGDVRRLDLCLREDIRKIRGPKPNRRN